MKQVAILAAISTEDVWNISISFKNHFLKFGYEVVFYNTLINDKFDTQNFELMLKDYKNKKINPDIVFHLDFGFFTHSKLNKSSIPTAKWIVESGDDPQNFQLNASKIINKNFDLVLSPDIRCVREYQKYNVNAVWCPHFADPEQYIGVKQEPIFDAVTTRSIEEPFFAELKNKLGSRFEARTNFLQGQDHSRHLKKGLIVVQNSKYGEITRRIFEGMMANRLVITDRPNPATEIDQIFTENKDIVYFNSVDDCVDKINYYSSNILEREQITLSGYTKVSNFHTTKNRIAKILEILK